MDKKQSGSAHLVITIILAVALIGTLGFVYWQNFMQPKDSENSQSVSKDTTKDTSKDANEESDTTPKSTNEGYLVLEDWGVKFKIPTELSSGKITYQKSPSSESVDYYDISTERVSALGSDCNRLFRLLRSGERFEDGASTPVSLGKVGSYYYGFQGPQSLCTNAGSDIQLADSTALRTMLAAIELE